MLCLVADDYREDQTEQIGRAIARRLTATARAMRLTQGQVFAKCNQGRPEGQEIISEAAVSSVMGSRVNNPRIGTVLIIAQALGLTLDQVVGITPLPEAVPPPVEDDVNARVERLEGVVTDLLERLALRAEQQGEAGGSDIGKRPRRTGKRAHHQQGTAK